MNRSVISFLLGLAVAGFAVFSIMRYQSARGSEVWAAGELMSVRQAVEKRLADICGEIASRLAAFAGETAADEIFALRLIAENSPSAAEVAGKAAQFMGPMGFSFLSIADSAGTILSSGHFPASRGDRMPDSAFRRLSDEPRLVMADSSGKATLSLQARRAFTVADSIPFFAIGGVSVDAAFLERLSPLPQVKVLLRRGAGVTGMEGVRTISAVQEGSVLLNDRRYPAFTVALDYAGEGEPPELIGMLMK